MKTKIKRTLAVASMLALVSSVPVMAAMKGDSNIYGSAKLDVNYANGLRNVKAETIRKKDYYSTYLMVETAYQSGQMDEYVSGVVRGNTEYEHSWEDAQDYSSNHKVLRSGTAYLDMSFTAQ